MVTDSCMAGGAFGAGVRRHRRVASAADVSRTRSPIGTGSFITLGVVPRVAPLGVVPRVAPLGVVPRVAFTGVPSWTRTLAYNAHLLRVSVPVASVVPS